MRRIMVLCLVVALMGSPVGCCTLTDSAGVETQSFSNCFASFQDWLQGVQDWVCNAPTTVVTIADTIIDLLKDVAEAYIPGTKEYTVMVTAQNIKATGCAGLTALNEMISFVQSVEFKEMQTKAMLKAGPTKATPMISVQPLIDWRDGVKK